MNAKLKMMRIDQMIRCEKQWLSSKKQSLDRWIKRIGNDSYDQSHVLDEVCRLHHEVKRTKREISRLRNERLRLSLSIRSIKYGPCPYISPIYDRDEIDDEMDNLDDAQFIFEFSCRISGITIE